MAKPKTGRRTKSKRPLVPIYRDAAGLDVGATFHVVAVPPERDPSPVRSFNSFTGDLHALADWLEDVGVTRSLATVAAALAHRPGPERPPRARHVAAGVELVTRRGSASRLSRSTRHATD